MTPDHFRRMLRVSKHAIDDALENQADDLDRISQAWARADERADELKAELARVEGRLTVAGKADNPKATVAELTAAVVQHRDFRAAQDALREANREAAEWKGLHGAWKERGYALKTLAELHGAAYFTASSHTMPRAHQDRGNDERRGQMREAFGERAARRAEESAREAGAAPASLRRRFAT